MLNKIDANNLIKNPSFKSAQQGETNEQKAKSTQDVSDKIEYIKLPAALLTGALVASGGIALALKAFKGKGTLSYCNIRPKDVSEELYNFLLHQKKAKTKFVETLDRNKAIKLNGLLNENNFSDFKKLSKTRFLDANEVIKSTEALNEHNSSFIDTIIARKDDYDFELKKGDFSKILRSINEDNKDFAQGLIESAQSYASKDTQSEVRAVDSLVDLLGFINKDNKTAFDAVFSSRIPYASLDGNLNFGDMEKITELIQKHKNPKSAKFFLSLKATNGPSKKFSSYKDISKVIPQVDDKYIDCYAKHFSEKSKFVDDLAPVLTDKNAFFMPTIDDYIANANPSTSWQLPEILKIADESNGDLAKKLMDKLAQDQNNLSLKHVYDILEYASTPEKIQEATDFFAANPTARLFDFILKSGI